jgi:hypothetical protein
MYVVAALENYKKFRVKMKKFNKKHACNLTFNTLVAVEV